MDLHVVDRTYFFIVNGADLEYAKKIQIQNYMVDDAVLEYIYIEKE